LTINSLVEKYVKWEEREKWLLLRKIAYKQLRNRFFSSIEDVNNISQTDFKKHYLGFGSVSIRELEYKLTISTISSFLQKYSASKLEELIDRGEIEVVGNASWSQLHMGFKKEKWQDVRNGIRYLLFGDQNTSMSKIGESEAINRLKRVLEETCR